MSRTGEGDYGPKGLDEDYGSNPLIYEIDGIGAIGTSVDADALAFIAAAGITDATQKSALNTLVPALKSAGVWAKSYALYPFVGGTAATHKWNLKDPRDLDAAYRIVFNGTITHNANGITPGGTAADFADTRLNGLSILSKTDSHWSFYSRTAVDGGSDYGQDGTSQIQTQLFGSSYFDDIPTVTDRTSTTLANTLGFYNGNMGATNKITYKNGASIIALGVAAGTNYLNSNMLFGAAGPAKNAPSVRNLAFASIGQNLTAGEAASFYTAVQAFQTTLSRNV